MLNVLETWTKKIEFLEGPLAGLEYEDELDYQPGFEIGQVVKPCAGGSTYRVTKITKH